MQTIFFCLSLFIISPRVCPSATAWSAGGVSIGSIFAPGKRYCMNGSCTSIECSWSCDSDASEAKSHPLTMAFANFWSILALPSGVFHACPV